MTDASRPWLARYRPGIAPDAPPSPWRTLPEMMAASVARHGDRTAYRNFGVDRSFREIGAEVRAFAAYLQNRVGVRKGDRVAVMLPNTLDYPVAMFGILEAGAIVVSVNPLYTPRELEHQLKDSGAIAIVLHEGACARLQEVVARTPVRHVLVASIGGALGFPKGLLIDFVLRHVKKMVPAWDLPQAVRLRDAIKAGRGLAFTAPPLDTSDIAFLQYTGGTTGVSKGAALTHANVLAQLACVEAYLPGLMDAPDEVVVAALPLYHILALVLVGIMGMRKGAMLLLVTNPRDIPAFVKLLRGTRPTFFVGVNTLYNALVNHPDIGQVDFSALTFSGGGGAPLQLPIAEKWKALTGRTLIEGYGLTETTGAMTMNSPDIEAHTGTAGMPLPSVEVEIRRPDGTRCADGEPGEVFTRGPCVMQGYWNRPEETAKAIDADGFFATGDIGLITPEGLLKIVDRLKDMVLVSGFNVFPNEIEEVLAAHPGVLEAAAIGVPDAATGEAVKVFVVRKDAALSEGALITWCRTELTGYKVPKHVEFRDALPKSPVGKILRRELRG
ncbi:MAG: AMP-binding protein [Burkholderiales bacterium]|nr:AMP-binding protein [Burkholderiales bacterium]